MPNLFNFKTIITTLVLLALGYVALWYTVGFRTQKLVTATLSEWLDSGLRVKHADIELSGFPYRFVIEIDDLDVSTRQGGLEIASERLTLVSHLWTPDHWVVQAAGNTIALADGGVSFFEEFLQASYRMHDGNKMVVKIDSAGATDMRVASPGNVPVLTQWSLLLGKDYSGDAASGASGGLYEKRTLEFRLYAESGDGTLEFMGGISGPGVKDWSRTELGTWRDEGGLLEIDNLTWRTGPLELLASGDLTLDEAFRPLGSASIKANDWPEARKRLSAFGVVLPASLPSETALMMQNGAGLIEGSDVMGLPPMVNR